MNRAIKFVTTFELPACILVAAKWRKGRAGVRIAAFKFNFLGKS